MVRSFEPARCCDFSFRSSSCPQLQAELSDETSEAVPLRGNLQAGGPGGQDMSKTRKTRQQVTTSGRYTVLVYLLA